MPGDNCSIYGCTLSRRSKHKRIAIFKIPTGDTDFEKKWREKLITVVNVLFDVITRKTKSLILNHATRKTVKPGEIPKLNLPTKSIPSTSSSTKPRESADIVLQKRLSSLESFTTTHNNECYQSFSEFLTRVQSLKLHDWDVSITSSVAHFSLKDDLHVVPKFDIYIDEHLSFYHSIFFVVPS